MRLTTNAKRDANEPEIIEALREDGLFVIQHSGKGGEPDLFVELKCGFYLPLEVKGKDGKLTQAQKDYRGRRIVVRDADDALAICRLMDHAFDVIKRGVGA